MHRVRTWARTKAHGPAPLGAADRRPTSQTRSATGATASAGNGALAPAGVAEAKPPAESSDATPSTTVADAAPPKKKNVAARFGITLKDIILSSWINVLLVFVPIGIASKAAGLSGGIVFAMNAIAIIPLAGLLSHATESVASRLGDAIGALMNVTFGNAVELIIFIIALVKDELRIVQASLLGSILANLLLILGMCFLLGGLRYREQIYNSTATQMSACLLSLSVMSLLLPTAFHASFASSATADDKVTKVSRGCSVVLLLVYVLYLLFQLNSHSYIYESTPAHIIEAESQPGPAAHYFESSSSSDSSSSSSSDTDDSTTTTKRIRRMMRGKRGRKHSAISQPSTPSVTLQSPKEEATELSLPSPAEAGSSDPAAEGNANASSSTAAVADLADGDDEAAEKTKKHRRHKKKHHKHKKSPEPEAAATEQPGLLSPDGAEPRRVDFALASDLEAQPEGGQSKPFSLRSLRPQLAKNISQNVFTSPPQNPVQGLSPEPQPRTTGLRRTQSLPSGSQPPSYRNAPGSFPPIVPIVVNRQKTQAADDDEEKEPQTSRTTAILLLLISTALVAVCAEFMVDSINEVVEGNNGLSEAFIGLILLPIVGNAAEHVTAVTVAMKNKMDLAIGVALGSSIQIALFVTPLVVILGWIMNKPMNLFFTLFETISLFVSAFIVNFLVLDGRSNYLEGALLCVAYVIIAVAAFFYPNENEASELGGGSDNSTTAEAVSMVARMVAGGFANLG